MGAGGQTEERLRELMLNELVERGAVPGEVTSLVADALAEAEAIGMPEFGRRLFEDSGPGELRWSIEPTDRDAVVGVVEAEGVFAPVAVAEAAIAAATAAEQTGLALRVVKAPAGLGRLAPYAREIANRGLIGVITVGAPPIVAQYGAETRQAVLGTNPFSVALPSSTDPIVVDAATSAITMGRWKQLRRAGEQLPPGTAVDSHGNVTVDPELASTLLSRGGALGTITGIAVEMLSGGVAGMLGSSLKRRSATVFAIRSLDLEATAREVGDDLRARILAAGGRVPGAR